MHDNKGHSGIVFNIQRYSIHDGPGIRTTVFFKGCPLRCFWCQNPESQRMQPEVFHNQGACTMCGRCVSVCLTGASALSQKGSTIDRMKCIGCGKCAEACLNKVRTLVGRYVTVDEVMQEVIRDTKYYRNSGGGVTLSGGDPIAQPEFALSLLKSCKEAGLHTAIDTCGYATWESIEKLLEYTDLVLYDIKCMAPKKHREATGKSNNVILENARRIAKVKPTRIRVPIIPNFNDSVEEVRAIVHLVKTDLPPLDIDLLPYNKLGENKYERLGRRFVELQQKDEEYMRELENIIGICC